MKFRGERFTRLSFKWIKREWIEYIYMHDLRCLFVYGDIFITILKACRSAFSGGIYAPSWIVYHARRSPVVGRG